MSAAEAILGLLLIAESLIKPSEDRFVGQRQGGPVEDAERLWRGDYQTCRHCGMLNEPGARRCFQCNNLLFTFRDQE